MGLFANIGGKEIKLDKLLQVAASVAGVDFPVDSLDLTVAQVQEMADVLPTLRPEGDIQAVMDLRIKALQHSWRLLGWVRTAQAGETLTFL